MQEQKGFVSLSKEECYKLNGGNNGKDVFEFFDKIKCWLFGKK